MDAYPEGKDEEFPTIKPLIKELVRTQYCFPDLVLLVDKIIIAKVPSDGDSDDVEAYRLYLTDRQKSIQGNSCYVIQMALTLIEFAKRQLY